MNEKIIKFWALYSHIHTMMMKGLSLAEASVKFSGEAFEAAIYFDTFIKNNT